MLHNLKSSKQYRKAFVEEKVRTQLALQIKTIREQREMSRPTFASLLKKAASWVFRLEDPNQVAPTIPSLLNVADVFDVDLDIRFRRFSDLLNQIERMGPEFFRVPSFEDEVENNAFDVIEMPKDTNIATSQSFDEEQELGLNERPPLMKAEMGQLPPKEETLAGGS